MYINIYIWVRAFHSHCNHQDMLTNVHVCTYIHSYIQGAHASPPTPVDENGESEYKSGL